VTFNFGLPLIINLKNRKCIISLTLKIYSPTWEGLKNHKQLYKPKNGTFFNLS